MELDIHSFDWRKDKYRVNFPAEISVCKVIIIPTIKSTFRIECFTKESFNGLLVLLHFISKDKKENNLRNRLCKLFITDRQFDLNPFRARINQQIK
ncbi:MAG: hypothetical protein A2W90_01480 [Bacteroidetes bacterium GWF2_42_66]|nr:MAG: hypothetical protein A2W90_01480 [Bacteroidetes bacterium GWF2_42_66]